MPAKKSKPSRLFDSDIQLPKKKPPIVMSAPIKTSRGVPGHTNVSSATTSRDTSTSTGVEPVVLEKGPPVGNRRFVSRFIKFEGAVSHARCVKNLKQQAIDADMLYMYNVRVHTSNLPLRTVCHAKITHL
jgi:hypothetical protein